jgi:formylglycine-generating enzyme required for sulfatase activity
MLERIVRRGLLIVACVAPVACGSLVGADFSDARPYDNDAATESDAAGQPEADAAVEGGVVQDAGDAGAPCPGTAGPPGVRITTAAASYCIDATEVTRAQYATFLASVGSMAQPTVCAWNASFVPQGDWTTTPHDAVPVTNVDWCDAYMYCAWSGKRLCGRTDGSSGGGGASDSQWGLACRGDKPYSDDQYYPYGVTYDPTRCNGTDSQASRLVEVGSFSRCEGGFPGVFDLSGNASEWLDSCDPAEDGGGPAEDLCAFRGGNFHSAENAMRCEATYVTNRAVAYDDVGIRCCSR